MPYEWDIVTNWVNDLRPCPSPSPTVEETELRLRRLQEQADVAQRELEEARRQAARLPEEPPPGSVVKYVRVFGKNRYSFAAIHVEGRGWATTGGRGTNATYVTWAELVHSARKNRVKVITGWNTVRLAQD